MIAGMFSVSGFTGLSSRVAIGSFYLLSGMDVDPKHRNQTHGCYSKDTLGILDSGGVSS